MSEKKNNKLKLVIIVGVLAIIIFLLKRYGVFEYMKDFRAIKEWIDGFGVWGPVVYILVYIACCLFFLPGLPITIVGGLVFGSIWGTIYVSIGSTIGASLAFLIARYAARDMVESWVANNPQFKKIDEGVEKQGWRMLMITRLVPIFPFNLQNFAYGLTKIKFSTYVLVSWICMLPGTIAYVFAAGSLSSGQGDIKKTLIYLGIAAVFFVILSLIPGWIKKKYDLDETVAK
ncbi:hypothetical protein BBF96_01325 [Anoxybacter fermentans]|uniref:TVP38/TMEM64 family membrane protein n=1 Tax=Anoxybacter fermentans TaxID=1323375 RepID=A0A3Q9HNZ1_9FIRM|nr:TVP38/TMEM64 family protein [Anoxybacter fermentans]AZR72151.1 hypothetical protein BBF96_01325 [Anoxybacter fermentans]